MSKRLSLAFKASERAMRNRLCYKTKKKAANAVHFPANIHLPRRPSLRYRPFRRGVKKVMCTK